MKDKKSDKTNVENTEVNFQVELGLLLQKTRPVEDAKKVEKIIQGSKSIEEKIIMIKALDKPAAKSYLNRRDLATSAAENQSGEFDVSGIKLPSFSDLRKARKNIKSIIEHNTMFRYLFRDFSKIKFFGIKNHVLTPGLFFFHLHFNSNLPNIMVSFIQKDISIHLAPGLKYILKEGWMYLSKEEYNTLNLLYLFVDELLKTNFSKLDLKNRNLIDNFKKT